ncbi:MAG: hypothetical protein IJW64_06560 [Clostridia bacterium]|nr:hypothetical protein [Clostridia bacterium]
MDKNIRHTLLIEQGQGLIATAVLEVSSFNEKEIRLNLSTGGKLAVFGEKLKINGFDKNSGELKLSGAVLCVKYATSTSSKIKKLFG